MPDTAQSWPLNRHEAQRLAASLRFARLSLLFGDPGAGKTTLLRDGVLPLLRRRSVDAAITAVPREGSAVVLPFPDRRRRDRAELVVHVADWGDAPLSDVHQAIDAALRDAGIAPTPGSDPLVLADRVADLIARHGNRFLFVIDRFEQLLPLAGQAREGDLPDSLASHGTSSQPGDKPGGPANEQLLEQLIELLSGPLPVNALLAMRADAASAFEPIGQRIGSAAEVLTLAPRGLSQPLAPALAAMPVLRTVVDLADGSLLSAAPGRPGPQSPSADDVPRAPTGKSTTGSAPEPEPLRHGVMRPEDVYASIAYRLAQTSVNLDTPDPVADPTSSFGGVEAEAEADADALGWAPRDAPNPAERRTAAAAPPRAASDASPDRLPDYAVIDEMFARNPPVAPASVGRTAGRSARPARSRLMAAAASTPIPMPAPAPASTSTPTSTSTSRVAATVGGQPVSSPDRSFTTATAAQVAGGKSSGAGSTLFIRQRRSLQRLVLTGLAVLLVVGAAVMWRVQQQRASSRLPTMATIHEQGNHSVGNAAPGPMLGLARSPTSTSTPSPSPSPSPISSPTPTPTPTPTPAIAGTRDIAGAEPPGVAAASSPAAPVVSAAASKVADLGTATPPTAASAAPTPALPTIDLQVDSDTMQPLAAELARAVAGEGGVALHLSTMQGGPGALASGTATSGTSPRLAIVRYDTLQAAARTRGDARRPSLSVVAPLFTEAVFVVVRADSNLWFLNQLKGRRIASGPADGARTLTATTLYKRMFGVAMPPGGVAEARAAAPPAAPAKSRIDARAKTRADARTDTPADAAAEVRQMAYGDSPDPVGARPDAVVVTAPHPAAWLAALPADTRSAIRLLRLDPADPVDRRALQVYLPANLAGIEAAGVGDAAEVPSLSAMTFLVLEGRPDAAQAVVLNRVVTRLCRQLPALQRTGDPKWRDLRPGLELPTAWPNTAATARTWRHCEALSKGADDAPALATAAATAPDHDAAPATPRTKP